MLLKVFLWEGAGDRTELQYIDPPLLWPSALCHSCFPVLFNRRPGASAFCWVLAFSMTSCLWLLWSPTHWGPRGPFGRVWLSLLHLFSNSSELQLVDFLSPPSYIIVQSPTQSLEWHVWSSSSGNNCHAVQKSLSSGASVYECIIGFYLVPFRQPNPPRRFSFDYWPLGCVTSFRCITLKWHVWPVEGQYTTRCLCKNGTSIQHSPS